MMLWLILQEPAPSFVIWHTTKTIARWLKAAKRCVPNEIVCDDSSALLGAIAKVFTKTNCKGYLL